MLVYSKSEDDTDQESLWTKETLISVREFELDVKREAGFAKTCLAGAVPGGLIDEVSCLDSGF